MEFLPIAAIVAGVAASAYLLHRLCLRLENRGLLYYRHRKPSGSAWGSLVALQQALEPRIQHVLQVEEEKRTVSEDEAPGSLDTDGVSDDDSSRC